MGMEMEILKVSKALLFLCRDIAAANSMMCPFSSHAGSSNSNPASISPPPDPVIGSVNPSRASLHLAHQVRTNDAGVDIQLVVCRSVVVAHNVGPCPVNIRSASLITLFAYHTVRSSRLRPSQINCNAKRTKVLLHAKAVHQCVKAFGKLRKDRSRDRNADPSPHVFDRRKDKTVAYPMPMRRSLSERSDPRQTGLIMSQVNTSSA